MPRPDTTSSPSSLRLPAVLPLIGLAALLAGCGSKTVKAEDLAQVPSARVDDLAEIQSRIAEVEDRLDVTEDELARARTKAKGESKALSALEKQKKKAQEREVEAISEGASALAAGEDATVQALASRLEEQRADLRAAEDTVTELELERAMLEQKIDWLTARLEAERALAASEGGADIKTRSFEKKAAKEQEKYADAHSAWVESLEADEREEIDPDAMADES